MPDVEIFKYYVNADGVYLSPGIVPSDALCLQNADIDYLTSKGVLRIVEESNEKRASKSNTKRKSEG